MALIRPISDLRNKSHELSALASEADEPIFITKNGEGSMVVMSIAHYRRMTQKMDLLQKLYSAEVQRAEGDGGRPMREVFREIREKLGEGKHES